ncbi:MAG TPA: hypothetical protein VFG46_14640, partial [Chryseolinea sp.]|nr:hypothetical protein [Chryseolinea sp.]
QDYVLARLRYQEDSLLYEDYVEIFFKGVPDLRLLKNAKPQKSDFPFYGWANLARDENGAFMRYDAERLKKLA